MKSAAQETGSGFRINSPFSAASANTTVKRRHTNTTVASLATRVSNTTYRRNHTNIQNPNNIRMRIAPLLSLSSTFYSRIHRSPSSDDFLSIKDTLFITLLLKGYKYLLRSSTTKGKVIFMENFKNTCTDGGGDCHQP